MVFTPPSWLYLQSIFTKQNELNSVLPEFKCRSSLNILIDYAHLLIVNKIGSETSCNIISMTDLNFDIYLCLLIAIILKYRNLHKKISKLMSH